MLNFFMMELRFSKESMAELIRRRPRIFYLQIEKIRPIYQFLEEYFDLSFEEMALVTKRYPRIITLDGRVSIEPKYEFLRKYFNLTDKELV